MFRGKESLNRIELSRLVQDLLNFGDLGSLWLWGVGGGWRGWVVVGGYPPHTCTCTCMHTHTHTHTHTCTCPCMCDKHDNFMQMATPIGETLGIPYVVICMCMHARAYVCMHVHVCWGTLSPPLSPSTHPSTPRGNPQNQSKFNST